MVAATAPSTPKPNGLNMISRRSLATSVAGAMVAALLALSGLPANAGDDGASPTTDKDAKATLAQSAVARAEQLSPLMDLDGAGKIVVDEAMGRVTISWNGKPPSEVSSQLGTDSNGVTVDAALTEYSMDALKKAMDRIWAAESESLNIVAIEPTEALDGLVVYAGTNSESARSSAERSLDAAVEPSVEVVSMAKERMPLASRQNDSAPWQGAGVCCSQPIPTGALPASPL